MDVGRVWEVEESLWRDGADAFRRHLDESALVVVPGATLDKAQTVRAIEDAPRWERLERDGEQTRDLGRGLLLLHYRASAHRGDRAAYRAGVSSVYDTAGECPRLVFHQQTPEP